MVGDQGGEGTPVPIPNTEVKLSSDMASSGEGRERQGVADHSNFSKKFDQNGYADLAGRVVMIIRRIFLHWFSKSRGETF